MAKMYMHLPTTATLLFEPPCLRSLESQTSLAVTAGWTLETVLTFGLMIIVMAATDAGRGRVASHMPVSLPTMRFGSTAKVLLKCKLKYYRISQCSLPPLCNQEDLAGLSGDQALPA